MQQHQKHDLAIILSVLATIATGVEIRVLIDHDTINVSSLVSGKLAVLKLRFSSPNIKYFMLGEEKGIIYADAYVDEGRAFGHMSVPREGYKEIAEKIVLLEKDSALTNQAHGEAAYNFLKIGEVNS